MPRYLLLLHDSGTMPEGLGPEEIQAIIRRYIDWRARVEAAGHTVVGHKLRDGEGRVLRGGDGRVTVTDGPFRSEVPAIGMYLAAILAVVGYRIASARAERV